MKYLISNFKEQMFEVTDLNGLNLISYCIQSFAWECLTEIVLALGHQVLEKVDEGVEATPAKYAKQLGFEKTYREWVDALLVGHKIDWSNLYTEEENKTAVMFHGTLFL